MANQRLNATITIGGSISGSLISAIGTTKGKLLDLGSAVTKLKDRQAELGRTIKAQENLGAAGSALRVQYAHQEIAALDKQIGRLRTINDQLRRIDSAKQANVARRAELRGSMFDTIALGATAAVPIVEAAKFEKSMLGVAKQVDGARDSSGKLTSVYYDMAKQIQMLGRETPIATNEIADMVTAGARMGIAKDDLIDFTKTTAKMAAAFELPAGELADQMGKIAGIFKIPIKQVAELGDAINYLDDNAISKGGDIIKVMQGDLAGAASTMGLGSKNAAALASTFLTLGESAERADTAASGMLRELNNAKMNPKRFQVGLSMIGMTGEEMQKGMIKDGQGTILKVLDKINALPQEKKMEAVTRLFGKDWGGAIAKLAGGVDEYRRQLAMATGDKAYANGIKDAEKLKDAVEKAGKAGGSMQREFDAMKTSTSAQFTILKNRSTEVAVTLGSVLLPEINKVMDVVGKAAGAFADFAKEHPVVTKVIMGTVTSLIAFRVVTLAAGYAMTFLRGAALTTAGVLAGTRAQIALSAVATKALEGSSLAARGGLLGMATSIVGRLAPAFGTLGAVIMATPIGWVVAGIAAIVAGAVLIYKYWEPLKAFFVGFGTAIVNAFEPIASAIGAAFSPIVDFLKPIVMPIIDWFGEKISAIVGWFSDLLTPITAASETTKAFGDAGTRCGELVASAFTSMLGPIGMVMDSIKWIGANIGTVSDKLVKFLGLKDGAKIEDVQYDALGNVTGYAPAAAPTTSLPTPAMATGGGAGAAGGPVKNETNITINQQPGQNSKELAQQVARELERQRAINRRSSMTDGAGGQ